MDVNEQKVKARWPDARSASTGGHVEDCGSMPTSQTLKVRYDFTRTGIQNLNEANAHIGALEEALRKAQSRPVSASDYAALAKELEQAIEDHIADGDHECLHTATLRAALANYRSATKGDAL